MHSLFCSIVPITFSFVFFFFFFKAKDGIRYVAVTGVQTCALPISPAILEIEKSRIFQRTWQLVGTLSQSCGEVNGVKRTISDPESFFTADIAGEPIIVVRDHQGTLRAFSNVCRHRAGPVALGSGCKNVL